MSAYGAPATSRMVANNVCFQAVATVTSMADIGAKLSCTAPCARVCFGSVHVDAWGAPECPLLTFQASKPQVRSRPHRVLTEPLALVASRE